MMSKEFKGKAEDQAAMLFKNPPHTGEFRDIERLGSGQKYWCDFLFSLVILFNSLDI